MPETSSGGKDAGVEAARAARLGSARADFVASLGRRVGELRAILNGLEQDPGSPRLRDDLRRRVHALSAGARLLRFAGMATALSEAERMLDRAASVGGLAKTEVRDISDIFEHLPSFADNEPTHEDRPTERPPMMASIGETASIPSTILVIGPSGLADAITQTIDQPGAESEIECERADTTAAGLELARALAPDVIIVDVDLPGAKDLVEKLGGDQLADPMPMLVLGTWATPEEGARWIALGAALALAKPISPHDLRKACMDLGGGAGEPSHHGPLGQATVEQLATLIMSEIKRGLSDSLVQGKSTPIQLGDGSDILAAVWGAVARVRDLVMIKSGGTVRFSNQGPEGALPIAPWWGDNPTPVPRGETKRDAPPRLEGRRVVVADDDPAVTWFIGGLLRAAGAEVREAHDGNRALELCFRLGPDLVITDVLMPGLDGFALCRALKRDISLRDVPVILLSWKEDLLQRLRDLGADADGYLRKEASAQAILQRVHEVLRTRLRTEARLKGEGEVRGRLDGVTPATLLQTIERVRPNARLCIRDASFLYEVEMRHGAPKSATRTTSDGSFQRGKDVFAALLGVRTGRYVVSRADGQVRGSLEGDLAMQMESPLAHARAALRLLGGTRLLEVTRVSIALDRVLAYLGATPEPARSLMHRLAKGASPRELILGGEVAPAHLEEVLCDLAARGAITGVLGASGVDLLGPALEHERDAIRLGGTPSHPPKWLNRPTTEEEREWAKAAIPEAPSPAEASLPAFGTTLLSSGSSADSPLPPRASSAAPNDTVPAVPIGAVIGRLRVGPAVASSDARTEPGPLRAVSAPHIEAAEMAPEWPDAASGEDRTPSSLEAALIREISDRTPVPNLAAPAEGATSIVDTSELKARIPGTPSLGGEGASMPSLPPDAIVPGNNSDDRIKASDLTSTAGVVPANQSDHRIGTSELAVGQESESVPKTPLLGSAVVASRKIAAMPTHETSEPGSSRRSPKRSGVPLAIVGAIAAFGGFVALLRNESEPAVAPSHPDAPVQSVVAHETPAPSALEPAILPVASVAAPAPAVTESAITASVDGAITGPSASASAAMTSGEDLPLPAGAVIAPGQGLLDIETGARESIFVDNVELGRGPFLRLTLAPGIHEVRLKAHGEERIRFVLIRTSRRTRLPLSSVWTR